MDLMGMLNQAIASNDTEANTGMMGSLLGALNNAPVDNSKIGRSPGASRVFCKPRAKAMPVP